MIFITGASGFVGNALLQRLQREGQKVVVGVRSDKAESWSAGAAKCVIGNLGQESLDHLDLHRISVVIHCAGRAHIMRDTEVNPLSAYRKVNVAGTLDLAKRSAACGVKRFIFISSIKVNGESTQDGRPFLADDLPDPQDPYGVSKQEAERGLRALADLTGMEVVIIRPPLVYGPGVGANFGALMRCVQRGWPLPLGLVGNQRSLVGLDNLVDFIQLCCQHPKAANQTFLVSDGQDVSTPQLLRAMAAAYGRSVTILPIPVWLLQFAASFVGKSDALARLCGNLQVDIQKSQLLLNWRPTVSLEDGLRRAVSEQRKA